MEFQLIGIPGRLTIMGGLFASYRITATAGILL